MKTSLIRSVIAACSVWMVAAGFATPAVSATETSALDSSSLYQSNTRWTTQDGKPLVLSELAGRPVVVAMLYTSCQAACPMIISDLKKIEAALPASARGKVRFLALSFDPVRDTPKQLKATMERQRLDVAVWTFAQGDEAGVREMAALLGIRYKPLEGGDFDHSNVITVLDQKGLVAHRQLGLRRDPAESVSVLESLLKGN